VRHKVELSHLVNVSSTLRTGRPRGMSTHLNDRDVADTVNSTFTVDGPQTLHCCIWPRERGRQ
jgi:hypothetical protein